MFVTEASCDACPRKCRLEIFRASRGGGLTAPGAVACVFPGMRRTPAWVLGPENPAPAPEIETTTAPPPVTTDRVLLACRGCSAPCLLEIAGPVDTGALVCQVNNLQVKWQRTL